MVLSDKLYIVISNIYFQVHAQYCKSHSVLLHNSQHNKPNKSFETTGRSLYLSISSHKLQATRNSLVLAA